jgi:hypothetical protein
MEEADAMKITGHQTAHVFRHYDLGNIDVLRERLAGSRPYVRSLKSKTKVRRLPRTDTAGAERVAG